MLSTSVAFIVLAAFATASPVPSQPLAGVHTLHEGKPRLSFAERAKANGMSIGEQIQSDRTYVKGKYAHNVKMAKVSQSIAPS